MDNFKTVKYAKGSVLYVSGQRVYDYFFMIKSGSAKSIHEVGEHKTVLSCGVDGTVGLPAYLCSYIYNTTAIADTDCEFFILRKDDIEKMFEYHKANASSNRVLHTFFMLSHLSTVYTKNLLETFVKLNFKETFFDEGLLKLTRHYIDLNNTNLAVYCARVYISQHNKWKPEVKELAEYIEALDIETHVNSEVDGILSISKDNFVYCDYEDSNDVYQIISGQVKITKIYSGKELLVRVLSDGEIFGFHSISNNKRGLNAITLCDVKLKKMSAVQFVRDLQENTAFATHALINVTKTIWLLMNKFSMQYIANPVSRVLGLLTLDVAFNLKNRSENTNLLQTKNEVSIDVGIDIIMELVGLSEEEKKFALVRLKEDKLLNLENDAVVIILDVDAFHKKYGNMYCNK